MVYFLRDIGKCILRMWLRSMKENRAVAVSVGASQHLAEGREKRRKPISTCMADRMTFRRKVADGQSWVQAAKEYARYFRVI